MLGCNACWVNALKRVIDGRRATNPSQRPARLGIHVVLIVFHVFVHEAVPKERVHIYVRWNAIRVSTLHAFGLLALLSESFSSPPLTALWLRALRGIGGLRYPNHRHSDTLKPR